MALLTTQTACDVIQLVVAESSDREITAMEFAGGVSGPDAAELARISYRQLDHWARQGWVKPSVDPGQGRGGVRVYAPVDVLRLAVLRHAGRSGWALKTLGPVIGELDLPAPARFVVIGSDIGPVTVSDLEGLASMVSGPGRWTVCDLSPVRRRLARRAGDETARKSSNTSSEGLGDQAEVTVRRLA